MSALPQKADMCSATADVCYGPKADIQGIHSITSSARASNEGGTVRPSALAALRLIASSNLVGCQTGKSAGFARTDVDTGLAKRPRKAGAITDEATGRHILARIINCGHRIALR
jgi:hypothetical protein